MLKASVQMRFQTQTAHDTVMMAVDVCVDAIEALEDVLDIGLEV